MATPERMIVVDERYLLPEKDAVAMASLILKAEFVDRQWSSGGGPKWKYCRGDRARAVSLEPVAQATLAAMEMEES